ncbi:MAG: rhamnogalacturonan acetylesterase [Thalassobius sp.]|nr:rhamnogalacturonan acetylesterase [Thalassovita sp.]
MNVTGLKHFGFVLLLATVFYSCTPKGESQTTDVATETDEIIDEPVTFKFDFGDGNAADGYKQVTSTTFYSPETGYGLVSETPVSSGSNNGKEDASSDFLTSEHPFYFTMDMPEGNYRVKITFGNEQTATKATVKAESRRLMLYDVNLAAGEFATKNIVVNVRTPKINEQESIRLKSREHPYLNWDNQLTLEFSNKNPNINSIEITEDKEIPAVFLAGNSTVVDQEYEPWAAWGQMFPVFLKDDIAVANFAESGETLKAFVGENRLKKVMSKMKAGDFLFIEFAHNDQKPGGAHVDAFTGYKELVKRFIKETKDKGATPILVTSMHRRRFDEQGKIINTLENYPEAMRQTAEEEQVALVDLNAMSKDFYEAMGVEDSKKAFVHFAAGTFPGQEKDLADDTHFSTYGAYELAKCIVEGVKDNVPELAKHLRDNLPEFDPAKPDDFESFDWPLSPSFENKKPDGN